MMIPHTKQSKRKRNDQSDSLTKKDAENEIFLKYFNKKATPDPQHEKTMKKSELETLDRKNNNQQTKRNKKKKKKHQQNIEEKVVSEKLNTDFVPYSSLNNDSVPSTTRHPFIVDPADHAETPNEAYSDISKLLENITKSIGKTKSNVIIYDPYYCDGSVKKHLKQLGYPNVYNKNEDFYKMIENTNLPYYDILLTNPPYSGDHMSKLLTFCSSQLKPWIILVPNYVYCKPYYLELFPTSPSSSQSQSHSSLSQSSLSNNNNQQPFFLIPKKRYTYFAPLWQPSKKLGGATSPFLSIFICHLKDSTNNKHVIRYLKSLKNGQSNTSSLDLARSAIEMPYHARTETDPLRSSKRPNPKQRKKMAMMKNKS